jgi:hypothetical protein
MVKYTKACFDTKAILVSLHLALVDLRTPIGFALLESPFSTPHHLAYMSKNELSTTWCNA